MAKKQETKTKVVEKPQVVKQLKTKEDNWEIKDRNYYLSSLSSPLSYSIRSSNIY